MEVLKRNAVTTIIAIGAILVSAVGLYMTYQPFKAAPVAATVAAPATPN